MPREQTHEIAHRPPRRHAPGHALEQARPEMNHRRPCWRDGAINSRVNLGTWLTAHSATVDLDRNAPR